MTSARGPLPCPSCAHPVPSAAVACGFCGLPLTGPVAEQLLGVVRRLWDLDAHRRQLEAQRAALVAQLRQGQAGPVPPPPPAPAWQPAATAEATAGTEVSGTSAQWVLLALGGLLVALAAVLFLAFAWGRLGVGGRTAVLTAITVTALVLPYPLRRRGLRATAESIAAVAAVLLLLDAAGLRRLDVLPGSGAGYWAVATGLVGALLAGYGVAVRLTAPAAAAPPLLQLPALLGPLALHAGADGWALGLACAAAADLAAALVLRGGWQTAAAALGAFASGMSALLAVVADLEQAPAAGTLPLLLLAVLGIAAAQLGPVQVRSTFATCAGLAFLAALFGPVRDAVPWAWVPAVLAGCAFVLLLLPAAGSPLRTGFRYAGAGVLGLCLVTGTPLLLLTAGRPWRWTPDAWTGGTDALAHSWPVDPGAAGGVVVLALVAAACLLTLRQQALAVGLAGAVAATTPVVLGAGYPAAVTVAVALAVGGGVHRLSRPGVVVPLVLALGWSLAALPVAAAVWSLAALAGGLLTVRRPASWLGPIATLAGAATALGAGLTWAGLGPVDQSPAFAGLAAPALLLSLRVRGHARAAAESAALVLGAVAILLAVADPSRLSLVLALLGALSLARALRRDRRVEGAVLGVLLLCVASWIRLALADVGQPEPYTAGLSAASLVLGLLLRRLAPSPPSSWAAYGPGLALTMLPSVVALFAGDAWARALALGTASLALVVVGARFRLQAPLVLGAVALVLVGVHELAPELAELYALVPHWIPLALAGVLLIALGATYESRLRNLRALTSTLRTLQ